MRIADMLMAIPVILLGLVLVAAFGASTVEPDRHPRASSSLRRRPGSRAARCSSSCAPTTTSPRSRSAPPARGSSRASCFPNALPVLDRPRAASILAEVIFVEASLSFVGLGIQPPDTSWGTLLQQGYSNLYRSYAYPLFPGLVILVAVLALNVLGDNLQKVLDPSRS